MLKRSVILFFLVLLLEVGFVLGASISVTDNSATEKKVNIASASNLYAYEVNFSIDSGSISSVTQSNFLGATSVASYGSSQRNSYLYIYGSRLDSSKSGISGSGELSNVSFTGGITLRGLMEIDTSGSTTYTSYNVPSSSSTSSAATSSGGGGGSGAVISTQESQGTIIIAPDEMTINVISGVLGQRVIFITNNLDKSISLSLSVEKLGGIVSFDSAVLNVPSQGEEKVNINILADKSEILVGTIIIKSGNSVIKTIPIIINVKSENFLFDSSLTLSRAYRTIERGNNLQIQVDLQQVGRDEKVDVIANYIIKDFEGNVYLEDSETFFVEGGKSFTKNLDTFDLPQGDYVVGLEIVYPGAFATSSTRFTVVEEEGFINSLLSSPVFEGDSGLIIIIVGGTALVILVVVIIWALRRGRKHRKHHK